MKDRYWLYRRGNGFYYIEDRVTGNQRSLRTRQEAEARHLWAGRNGAAQLPQLSRALARTYLAAQSPEFMRRTWLEVMAVIERGYQGPTLTRWRSIMRSASLAGLRGLCLLETTADQLLEAMSRGGSSTNKALRLLHNRALDLGWLLAPVLVRRAWPKIQRRPRPAITEAQHGQLVETEPDAEFRGYLEMLWETGGSQSDIARLSRDNITGKLLTYGRQKLASAGKGQAALVVGEKLGAILDQLPRQGLLFPRLAGQSEKVRASRFRKRCDRLGFLGISLHSYRYAWAQRAKVAGMPLREAMAHLGHGSSAVHRAYAGAAQAVVLPLDFYENQRREHLAAATAGQACAVRFVPNPGVA
jgi:integrase